MLNRFILHAKFLFICFILSLLYLSACGSGGSSAKNDGSAGSYKADLIFPEDIPRLTTEGADADRIDCRAAGISTIEFYFSVNGKRHQPNAFDCMDGSGMIAGVPADEEVSVEVFANDADGIPILKGSEVVSVTPGQRTVGGEIAMEYVPFQNASPSQDTAPPNRSG